MARVREFIQQLEKAELHLHLEGAIEPETLVEIDPSLDLNEVQTRYRYKDFAGFIESFVWANRFLKGPAEYALITRRLLERLEAQNVRYAEIILAAGVVLWKGQSLEAIYDAVWKEARGSKVTARFLFDATRQFGEKPCRRMAEIAAERVGDGVVAIGLGGDEARGPADWFRDVFEWARGRGLRLHCHAGETTSAESVWSALRIGAERIGHGIRSIDDARLIEHLRDKNIPLEICISSNLCTGAVPALERHPLRLLFDAGVPVTLGSDDPAMFHTTLTGEYELAARQFGFTEQELRTVAANGFRFAFTDAGKNMERTCR
jgi:adenosine deaminase/aminodeoxyfutalosine deaminase